MEKLAPVREKRRRRFYKARATKRVGRANLKRAQREQEKRKRKFSLGDMRNSVELQSGAGGE